MFFSPKFSRGVCPQTLHSAQPTPITMITTCNISALDSTKLHISPQAICFFSIVFLGCMPTDPLPRHWTFDCYSRFYLLLHLESFIFHKISWGCNPLTPHVRHLTLLITSLHLKTSISQKFPRGACPIPPSKTFNIVMLESIRLDLRSIFQSFFGGAMLLPDPLVEHITLLL